jgi:hypothetical protein
MQTSSEFVIQVMSGLRGMEPSPDPAAAEGEVADAVEQLVAGAFIRPAKRVVFNAVVVKDEEVVGRRPLAVTKFAKPLDF